MTISAQPAYIGSTKLRPMFEALVSPASIDPIQVRSGEQADKGNIDTLDFTKRELSLKERVMNLINANKPQIALDIMQHASFDDPELFEAIADGVYENLIEAGFDKDAEELKRMSPDLSFKPEQEKPDYTAALQSLVM